MGSDEQSPRLIVFLGAENTLHKLVIPHIDEISYFEVPLLHRT